MKTRRTNAYGLWEAVLTLPDGRIFTGYGLSAQAAAYKARRKAQEAARGR